MKRIKQNIMWVALTALLAMGLTSCTNEEVMETIDSTQLKTCKLEMDVMINDFDSRTRATAWGDNECIYLLFNTSDGIIKGKAVFSTANSEWTLYYYGSIPTTASGTCLVFNGYGDTSVNGTETVMTLSPKSAVYTDESATYSHADNVIKVKATLTPKTGRIRFKGEPGTSFGFKGLKYNTSMELTAGQTTTESNTIDVTIDADGYSPYYYGSLAYAKKYVSIIYGNTSFYKICGSDVLAAGKSGYIEAPTTAAYNGWTKKEDQVFSISDVTFKMVHVNAGKFTMGMKEIATPTHTVTLSDYLIGETEVTQELWEAVMGSSLGWYEGENFPVNEVSWEACQTFITELNKLTGRTFSLPTEAQWEFAAKGGNFSEGYTYSGGNELSEVGNCNSSYPTAVAQYKANELGLYDMTGNVFEWCQDWYGDYSSSAATNPTGPETGSGRIVRGGSFYQTSNFHNPSYRRNCYPNYTNSYSYYDLGFRLSLIP